jgi:lipoprotein-anchoring transpeptidase ErfK/SrfK
MNMKSFVSAAVAFAITACFSILPAEAAKQRKRKNVAPAAVQIYVDVSSQSMSVSVNGSNYANWRVSTAKPGYYTPRGSYGVQRMHKVYYSKKYDNAPMPNSIFFRGPYAIHGTYQTGKLGRPASRGCVRLAPGNAAALFALVKRYGRARITVVN